jgi:hypothetical protein
MNPPMASAVTNPAATASRAAVERYEERQPQQQVSRVAGRVVVRGEVLRTDRCEHEQADDGGPSTPS